MNFTIEPMTSELIGQAAEIEALCFSNPWSRRLLEEELERENSIFLAAAGPEQELLGFVCAQAVLDEGCINTIAVRPERRRLGVATRLMEELKRYAIQKKLAFLTLEVRESNHTAQALYAKQGYRTVGCRRNYYERPKEDAILMTLEFGK